MGDLLIPGLLAVIASGAFANLIVKLFERSKTASESKHTDAQATDVLVQASERAVDLLRGELERAMSEIRSMRAELDEMKRAGIVKDNRIMELEREVVDLRGHINRLES